MKDASLNPNSVVETETYAQRLRILLAEDTPISAEAMRAMAAHLNVEMDVAENGLQAIEMTQQAQDLGRPYSLLLTDVMMPILDGIETTKRLRSQGFDAQTLPIIAITAATSFDEIRSYRACGMQAFLAKPVTMKDLRAALDAWGHDAAFRSNDGQVGNDASLSADSRASQVEPALLESLETQFSDRNRRTLALVEDTLSQENFGSETIDEIRNLMHQIAGTASTFGDPDLSEVARIHEHNLIKAGTQNAMLRQCLEAAAGSLKERIAL